VVFKLDTNGGDEVAEILSYDQTRVVAEILSYHHYIFLNSRSNARVRFTKVPKRRGRKEATKRRGIERPPRERGHDKAHCAVAHGDAPPRARGHRPPNASVAAAHAPNTPCAPHPPRLAAATVAAHSAALVAPVVLRRRTNSGMHTG
jgi:hypothetical protein